MAEHESSIGELLRRVGVAPAPGKRDPESRQRSDAQRRMRDELELRKSRDRLIAQAARERIPGPLLSDLEHGVKPTPAVKIAREWYRSGVRGLVLRGGHGVGKSCAAAVVALDAIGAGTPVSEISWHRPDELVSSILHAYDHNALQLGRSLVVIDEMGSEAKPDFVEALCRFLDLHDARFVITTMLARPKFWERYGEKDKPQGGRLMDRLNHFARAFTIKGESMRRHNGGV